MTPREVVLEAVNFRQPPYVPWEWAPTQRCGEELRAHLGTEDLGPFLGPHFVHCGASIARVVPAGEGYVRDAYGVVWDRTVDPDIGNPVDWPIKTPGDLDRYTWPDAADDGWYAHIPEQLAAGRGRFSVYAIGFSLYERAWTMRGMENLLMDMVERPRWVEQFLDAIVAHNLVQVRRSLEFDFDAVYFGDDYGMQTGLIMGAEHWRHFIKPRLARMFEPVRSAGKPVYMHSCGKVDSLFDDLVEIGLNLFNPFQPEVMDVHRLLPAYRGRLAFHGGMSVQKVLPFAAPQEVRDETQRLLDLGREGGLIFAPSHAVPAGVPPENLVAMVDVLKSQPGYRKSCRRD